MIITYTKRQDKYFESYPRLQYRTSGDTNLIFTLDAVSVSTFMAEKTDKKPTARFFMPSGEEIPALQWTGEMQQYAQVQIATHPVSKAGSRFTLAGKIIMTTLSVFFLSVMAYFAYIVVLQKPQNDQSKSAFLTLPNVGDRYFGSLSGGDFSKDGKLKQCWVKVESMQATDSTGEIRLGKVTEPTFDTKSIDHENFSGPLYRVTFRQHNDKIAFRSSGNDVELSVQVINNNYDNYKIPVNNVR